LTHHGPFASPRRRWKRRLPRYAVSRGRAITGVKYGRIPRTKSGAAAHDFAHQLVLGSAWSGESWRNDDQDGLAATLDAIPEWVGAGL